MDRKKNIIKKHIIMDSTYNDLIAILIIIGILFAIYGLFMIIKARILWKGSPDDVIRARAFLNKRILDRNFMLIFIMNFLVAAHLFLEYIYIYGLPSGLEQYRKQIIIVYILLPISSMLLLILLANNWLKLLSPPK